MFAKYMFKNPRFRGLFWTQFLGALNDNFFKTILVLLLVYRSVSLWGHDHNELVSLAGGVFILPYFLFSSLSGQLADKYSHAKLARYVKVSEVIIMLLACVCLMLESYPGLFGVLFLMGTHSTFFGPIKYGIIPRLIEKNELIGANASVSGGTFIAILMGTMLGGLAVTWISDLSLLAIGPLLVAIIGVLTSLAIPKLDPLDPQLKVDWALWTSGRKILALSCSHKRLLLNILGISWFWFLGTAVLSLLPGLAKDIVGGSESISTLFLTLFTLGMGVGAVVVERLSRRKIEVGLVPIAMLGMGLSLFWLYSIAVDWPSVAAEQPLMNLSEFFINGGSLSWKLLASLFCFSLMGGIYIVPQMASIQHLAPASKISQVIAANNIWNAIFMVVSSLFVMLMVGDGLLPILVWLGGFNLVFSFLLYAYYSEESIRLWMRLITYSFYDIEVQGEENIPSQGPFILICNHMSYVDWMLMMGVMPHPVRFVIDYNYYYQPMLPFWLRQAKLIPIATRKEDPEILKKAFEAIAQNLEEGAVIGFFPEGRISRDRSLGRFQPGLIKILKRNPVQVLPMSMDGLWGSLFSFSEGRVILKRPRYWRKRIVVRFAPPIAPDQYEADSVREWIKREVSDYQAGPEAAQRSPEYET